MTLKNQKLTLFQLMNYLNCEDTMVMKTDDLLKEATKLVGGQRQKDYGDKVDNHKNIATLWTAYLDSRVTAHDVAIMMCLLKIARTKLGEPTNDTYIDMAAYGAIAGEIKQRDKE